MTDSFPRQHARTQRFTLGAPRNFSVAGDGERVLFLRSRGSDDPVTCLWAMDTASGDEELLADPRELLAEGSDSGELPAAERARRERAREGAAGIVAYATDAQGSAVVFALAGRAYLLERGGRPRLLETEEGLFDPRLAPDGTKVSYVVGSALHTVGCQPGAQGSVLIGEGDPDVSWGSAEFVAAEEMRRTRGHWWSPDSTRLVVARVDVSPVDRWFIADPAQPWREAVAMRYPAAGTANAAVSLGVVTAEASPGEVVPIEWDTAAWPYLVDVSWPDGGPLTMVVATRDQRAMEVWTVDPDSGDHQVVGRLTDPHWVEIVPGTPRWHGADLLTVCEGTVTRELRLGDRVLSSPDHWVRDLVGVDDGTAVYTASVDPTEIRLFAVPLAGGSSERPEVVELAEPGGVVSAVVGPGVRVTSVTGLTSPAVWTVHAGDQQWGVQSLAAAPLVDPVVEVMSAGSRAVRTAVLFPSAPHDGPLPVLLDPYGGPHAQRVLRSRSAFLASQWLADQGFCVVVADGRGTPGRGDGWERAVRGDLAGPVLDDQLMALDAVLERYQERLDPDRVGVRGWSFGGYLAALAVLRRPDRFHAAVAGAPVTEWRWYDTHYTERYLGHPDEEPENYERTSLVAEAHRLERPLLLIHGLADDNVVAAHSLQLSSALLAAGRPHEVLPLSGVTHMTPQERVAENLLLLQVEFLHRHLAGS